MGVKKPPKTSVNRPLSRAVRMPSTTKKPIPRKYDLHPPLAYSSLLMERIDDVTVSELPVNGLRWVSPLSSSSVRATGS